jgi:hypothetical protein
VRKDTGEAVFKPVGLVIGVVLLVVGLIFGGVWFAGMFSSTTAETRGSTEQRERNQADGAFRQSAYEEFFDLCASAQSAEAQIKNLKDELETKPSEDRVERINTSITALRGSRAEAINTYNSKAGQKHRAQFQASNLPTRLNLADEETQCTA